MMDNFPLIGLLGFQKNKGGSVPRLWNEPRKIVNLGEMSFTLLGHRDQPTEI